MHWTRQFELDRAPPLTEIDADLYCVSCGYNLRGARPDGRCPECGEYVEASIKPPAQLEDVAGELTGLSWSYFGLVAIVATLGVPVGLTIGWMGAIFIAGALAYRIATLLLLRRSLRDHQPGRATPLGIVLANTAVEFSAIAVVLMLLTFSHALGVRLTDGIVLGLIVIWAGSTITGLWLAGSMAMHLQQSLQLPPARSSIIASRWLIGVSAGTGLIAAALAVVGAPGGLALLMTVGGVTCLVVASLLVFIALQYIADNLHAGVHDAIEQLQPKQDATPSDEAAAKVAAATMAGGSAIEPAGGMDDEPVEELPPIPLTGEGNGHVPPDRAAGEPERDDDDPMRHL